jgi:nucleoside-diphosphate-sugar epimerase
MRVLVTGYLGYVGSLATKVLLDEGHEVTGCDVCYYPQDGFAQAQTYFKSPKVKHLNKDIRDMTEKDLEGHDAVLHFAALSNDPLGEINPDLTNQINYVSSVKLAKLAKNSKVKRYVFSSSCSVYGASSKAPVDENSPVDPLTAYAKSKIESEPHIIDLQDENFCPTILRSATAYGLSPSLRLDLVANNLTASAFATGKVRMLTDGTPWRPLLHVEDMARAFVLVLKSQENKVRGEIFNVGSNSDNYTVKDIAEVIAKTVPNSKIEYAEGATSDPRSYRVNFNKIKEKIGFLPKRSLKEAIEEFYHALKNMNFSKTDFEDKKFYRVKYLKWLIEQQKLDNNLRFTYLYK